MNASIDTTGLAALDRVGFDAAALLYAERGFRVVPLHAVKDGVCSCPRGAKCEKSAGKHPRFDDWPSEASSDRDKVAAWFKRWPGSNVGLAMGGEARLVALDVDGETGRATLAALEAERGPLPRTLTSRSGRADGGEHRIFRLPECIDPERVKSSKLGKNLDVRCRRSQIVACPSMHRSGASYRWIDDAPIAELPPAWCAILPFEDVAAPASPRACDDTSGATSSGDALERAIAYLDRIDPAISGQRGHDTTIRAAEKMAVGFDLGERAVDVLERHYNPRCQPPWSRRELEHKIRDAIRTSKNPRGYLLDAPEHSEVDLEREAIQSESPPAAKGAASPALLSPADYIRSTVGRPCVRLATGLATLDKSTRGGLMVGKLVVLGGAPNAGKTTLAVQLGEHYARAGHHVLFVAKDEDREGILYRIGQLNGVSLDDLENDAPDARERLAMALDELPTFGVRDQDEEGVLLEQAVEELAARAGDDPAVLIVDSLQTVRTAASAKESEKRQRVEANTATLKAIARARRWLVIATCELARAAYRTNDGRDRIADLAAFKESGDIEYAVAVGLVLRTVAGEPDLVDVALPKVKRGSPEPFRLQLFRASARFREVDLPVETPREKDASADFDADVEAAREALRRNPGVNGKAAWAAKFKGGKRSIGTDRAWSAMAFLEGAGEVENRGNRRQPRLYFVSSPQSPGEHGEHGEHNSPRSPPRYRRGPARGVLSGEMKTGTPEPSPWACDTCGLMVAGDVDSCPECDAHEAA